MSVGDVRIAREVQLVPPGAFADIVVALPSAPSYYVEIKYGLSLDEAVRNVRRKYAVNHRASCNRLVVVVRDLDEAALQARLRDCVCTSLDVEVWNEARLLADIKKRYGASIEALSENNIIQLHRSMLQANWKGVYGDEPYYEVLASSLLWHFSPWTLKRLQTEEGLGANDIWRPGSYSDIAIVMADLSSFSRYVHDTPDQRVVQQVLTAFYSQTRQAIHEYGGMFYQFVGDEVVALFGYPDAKSGYIDDTLRCAKALLDIGASTSARWERHIDMVEEKHGLHIGIALGQLNLMPLRPFAHSHIGFIGDALNMTARLLNEAQPGEIFVSNAFYQQLSDDDQSEFAESAPVEARNIGTVKGWRRAAER
ncbi:MAG: hypothetical protein JO032_07455 [Alphaproteobacteria bacterium]|nr:hypothetical protein [Alphaproteobacteria bacterium]